MKFETIGSLTEFEKLEDDWRALSSGNEHQWNVFSGFDWHRAVLNTSWPIFAEPSSQLAIVVGRRSGKAELICPFVLSNRFAIKRLTWIGDPVSQYGDVLATPGNARPYLIDAALKFLAEQTAADAFVLERVREDAAIAATIQLNNHVVLRRKSAPYIDLDRFQSAEKFFASFSRGRRKQHRRLWRRLEELEPATFKILTPGPQAELRTKQALKLKIEMLAEQGTYSRAFKNPGFKPFFHDVASGRLAGTGFQICCLLSGDTLVAAEIGFRNSDTYVAHIGAYNPSFSQFAPGRLQIERTVENCFQTGIKRYDFLAPHDEYKQSWCNGSVNVVDYGVPLTNAGRIYCTALKLSGPVASIAKKTLPASFVRYATQK